MARIEFGFYSLEVVRQIMLETTEDPRYTDKKKSSRISLVKSVAVQE